MQNRFKSKVVWMAIIAQILSILITVGVIDMDMGAAIETVAVAVLELLVVFGVINNPTDGQNF